MPDGFEPIGSATSVVPTVAASADDLSGAGRPASGRAGGSRDDQTTELMPSCLGVARLAVGSFLARYREPTLTAYTQDLRAFPGWRQTHDREPLRVTRGELEIYVRDLEIRGYAAATVARRFGTVATFYTYAVIDGLIPASLAAAARRPKVAWEGQKRTVLHPLEFAALLAAARLSGPNDHALVCLVGILGLRSLKPAGPTSRTCTTRLATSCCTCSARAPSRPTSRSPSRYRGPCGKPSTGARLARSCGPAPAGGWTAPAPAEP
jgi:hypothetical protein